LELGDLRLESDEELETSEAAGVGDRDLGAVGGGGFDSASLEGVGGFGEIGD
jgi:hypothetical protein